VAKDVEASHEMVLDIFGRIENFFRRLEVYTTVQPTPAMTDMMVKIMVEVLDILGTATKEMKLCRASELILPFWSLEAHALTVFRQMSKEDCRNNEVGGWSEKAR
jgi:hypothetical protein